jgi:DNA-binding transcriptional MerR regulator
MNGYSIGQLAKAAGVPVSTVRFYERSGILKPDARTGGNYRHYTAFTLERLRFIRTSKQIGFSVSDIRALLQLAFDEQPCDAVLDLARTRLADVRQRLKDLKRVERALSDALDSCCKGRNDDICGVLSRLRGDKLRCRKPHERVSAAAGTEPGVPKNAVL